MQLDGENPWPGLESFEEEACAFFFGRDREAASLLDHVRDAPVTVLYGRSGLGKTSLLRAGLFPLLREQNFLPVYVRLELRPGAAPLPRPAGSWHGGREPLPPVVKVCRPARWAARRSMLAMRSSVRSTDARRAARSVASRRYCAARRARVRSPNAGTRWSSRMAW
jgi:hypothetical protein